MDTNTWNAFCSDLCAAQEAIHARVIPNQTRAADSQWSIWADFCTTHNINPLLNDVANPIPIFQVFAH